MELVQVNDNKLTLTEKALDMLAHVRDNKVLIQELKNEEEEVKLAIKKAMIENGIKKFDCPVCSFSYTPAGTKTQVNTKRMKADGVYDDYVDKVPSSDRLTITYHDVD